MIIAKEFPDKEFATKQELFTSLRENKALLIAQKKMMTKQADSTFHYVGVDNEKGEIIKADFDNTEDAIKLKGSLVINTTNLLDSHGDVHLKGIWNKSVKEQKNILLLQEHKMSFASIISDSVNAKIKKMSWKELGFDLEGETEALIFDTEINKNRNDFMFNQYSKGFVKEHSVGMRYVKMELALNSESKYDVEEKVNWDKYYPEVANKDIADQRGYFWAIPEAKIIEGSAVVKGSNYATPTISIEAVKDTPNEQQEEPSNDTQTHTIKRRRNI